MVVLAFIIELWGSFSAALLMSNILENRENHVLTSNHNHVAAAPIQQSQPVKPVFNPQPALTNFGYSVNLPQQFASQNQAKKA
jgi:hypothetical protein